MAISEADYIIVGGGLTGCAVASRLSQGDPSLEVLILEAGPDPVGNPNTTTFPVLFNLLGSELDWAFKTVPQSPTGDRIHTINAGKALGGGSLINYGGWSRGDASDYDQWAKVVGDARWSYAGQLPYFRKSENYYDSTADPEQHGFSGPIHVTSVSASDPKRQYPLREPIREAWTELGVQNNPTPCSGSLAGISESLENWNDGQRQPSNLAYGLESVQVVTDVTAHRVLFSKDFAGKQSASGVLLADGRQFKARKEVIISAGAVRTPQILMLSGIGPADTLKEYNIPTVIEAPEVGRNLFDHFAHYQIWKLRNPQKGLAVGSPLLADPVYLKGLPCDWAVNEAVPRELLESSLADDAEIETTAVQNRSILDNGRCHVETLIVYSSLGAPGIPMDGGYICSSVMLLIPTSRGTISIRSASPNDAPVIDSNHYRTRSDRTALIYGTRRVMQALMKTSAGKLYVEAEAVPPGFPQLTVDSTDTDIDTRIKNTGAAHYHPGGSAAMGQVVDSDLRVKGVHRLRVADASVLPVPIGGHPQATLYALAEQAAVLILQDRDRA